MIDDWQDEMTDEEKAEIHNCYVWCVGMLHELEEHGFAACEEGDRLSPKGIAAFDQMKATGWVPQKEMALATLAMLTGSAEVARQMWTMVERLTER